MLFNALSGAAWVGVPRCVMAACVPDPVRGVYRTCVVCVFQVFVVLGISLYSVQILVLSCWLFVCVCFVVVRVLFHKMSMDIC